MSYSASWAGPYEEAIGAIAGFAIPESSDPDCKEAMEEALKESCFVVFDLLESRVIAKEGQHVRISIVGHANPNHEPFGAYVDDCVTITISQFKPWNPA